MKLWYIIGGLFAIVAVWFVWNTQQTAGNSSVVASSGVSTGGYTALIDNLTSALGAGTGLGDSGNG
jgi:hypothetical protein